MNFHIGERKVEPLEQAEMAEVKIIAVDVVLGNDLIFAVGVLHDFIMVTALVKMGASFARIESHEFL